MNLESRTKLQKPLPLLAGMREHVPLADKNWFKTGGPARFFYEPTNDLQFADALQWAAEHNQQIFVLGQGANILVSDEGFDGLVLRPQLDDIFYSQNGNLITLTAGAGVTMDNLITHCLEHNILGLEEFSFIPCTVGGSVFINLHYYDFLLEDFLVFARVIDKKTGNITTVNRDWFQFGYNQSSLHAHTSYLLDATFRLQSATDLETAYAKGRRTEIIRHRVKRYPSVNTCGSFFRNFLPDEVTMQINNKPMIFVAYYLDKIGVKGELSVGGARVSHQHANMLVHTGHTTTTDIIILARTMQEKVRDAFGIVPQPECRLIGFKEYPLL